MMPFRGFSADQLDQTQSSSMSAIAQYLCGNMLGVRLRPMD